MSLQPLSSPQEQRRARELAAATKKNSADVTGQFAQQLADYLLRALAQIEALTVIADPTAMRFQQGNHRYPDLANAGLGHLWVGPSFNDFAPGLIEACRKHLKTHNLPAQRGHACDYIRNRIKEGDFGALEQRWSEALTPSPSPKTGRGEAGVPLAQAETAAPPPFGTPEYWVWQEQRQGGAK
jgi:hypothetical protein